MNKLVYVLTIGLTAVVITITTTVDTNTTGQFVKGAEANVSAQLTDTNTTVNNTVTQRTDKDLEVTIEDASGATLGTIDTATEISEISTVVDSGNVTGTGEISAKHNLNTL